ncbi:bacteriocin-like protein, partial [Vibrio parahaemolyticus]
MKNSNFQKLTREQLKNISGGGSCVVSCPGNTGSIMCQGPTVNCRSFGDTYDCSSYDGGYMLEYK